MDEPFSLRLARFFFWTGTLGLALFLLSDYSGYPQYSWLFWIMLAYLLAFLLRQRGLWTLHQQHLEAQKATAKPAESASGEGGEKPAKSKKKKGKKKKK